MLCDARKDIGQPGLRIDIVKTGGLDQRVKHGGALSTAIGAAEQPGLAPEGHAAQRPFGRVVREADPAIAQEPGEGIPAPEHVVYRLSQIVAARQLRELGSEPGVQVRHQWRAEVLPDGDTLFGRLAVDATLDLEQGIKALHGFQRNRIDHAGTLTAALPARGSLDVGQFEELTPCVCKAARLDHGGRLTAGRVELVVAAIGIGLQNPCP